MEIKEISFGPFRVDLSRRQLWRDEMPIRLQRRPLEILCALARAKGEVVTKDELLTQLWSGRIVEEGNLHVHVSSLRKALGEASESHSYIVTVPGRGYRLAGLPGRTSDQLTELSTRSLADKPSIAVLPFANLNGDPEQDYFANGIADEVITGLTRYPSLFVIARNSSFTYRGLVVDLKQVARELGVRYALQGSLRTSGNRIRVIAKLVEAETGNHLWAERYDRNFTDVFTVQDEITEAIITGIAPAIADAERKRAIRKLPANIDAWAAYQHGLWHLANSSEDDAIQADQWFRKSIELDRNFVGGYTGLALTHLHFGSLWGTQSMSEAQASPEEWIRRGVAVDGGDPQARSVLGITLYMRGECDGAEIEARNALALSPNLADAHAVLAAALIFSGRARGGLSSLDTCIRLDPRSPRLAVRLIQKAISYYFCAEYKEAAITAAHVIRQYPKYPFAYRWLAAALGQLNQVDEARQALKEAITIAPEMFDMFVRSRVPWMRPQDQAHMVEGLRKAGLRE